MKNNTAPARRSANNNVPLLTLERAIADGLQPKSLRQVAAHNEGKSAKRFGVDLRLQRQAENLLTIANKMELLGCGRAA